MSHFLWKCIKWKWFATENNENGKFECWLSKWVKWIWWKLINVDGFRWIETGLQCIEVQILWIMTICHERIKKFNVFDMDMDMFWLERFALEIYSIFQVAQGKLYLEEKIFMRFLSFEWKYHIFRQRI